MDTKLLSTILEGYSPQQIKDLKMPIVSDYISKYDNNDRRFLLDLAMYSSDTLFMKQKYQGPLEGLNQLILDNKELLISRIKDIHDYRSLRNLLARDFELSSSIGLFLDYKQVYQIDKTFLHDLVQTQYGNSTVPLTVFKHLPYESFYLDLEDTDICKYVYGTFVTARVEDKKLKIVCQLIGKTDDESRHSTSDGYFGTHTCRVLLDCSDPGSPDSQDDDVQIDCDPSKYDGNDLLLDTILKGLHDNYPGADLWDMCFMWYVIVPFLMYLDSDKPDIHDRPIRKSVQRRIKSNSASLTDQLKISEVGYVYGCSVRKYKKNNQRNTSYVTKDAVPQTKRSHMRRAHWHRYRCGKNRQDVRLIWMPPMYIQGNSDSAVTIHKVQ